MSLYCFTYRLTYHIELFIVLECLTCRLTYSIKMYLSKKWCKYQGVKNSSGGWYVIRKNVIF